MIEFKNIQLQPGDIFLSANPMALGKIINFVQTVWSTDNNSEYSHAGIILTETGRTLEAVWTVRFQQLQTDYKGKKVLIARHEDMGPLQFNNGYEAVEKHIGQIYPFWRLPLMIIPPIGRYVSRGRLACSELDAKFLISSAVKPELSGYKGINPDNIHDMVKNWRGWSIVYEGVI